MGGTRAMLGGREGGKHLDDDPGALFEVDDGTDVAAVSRRAQVSWLGAHLRARGCDESV